MADISELAGYTIHSVNGLELESESVTFRCSKTTLYRCNDITGTMEELDGVRLSNDVMDRLVASDSDHPGLSIFRLPSQHSGLFQQSTGVDMLGYWLLVAVEKVEFHMLHYVDCCEHVRVIDICGDVDDLLDAKVVSAEEATSEDIIPFICDVDHSMVTIANPQWYRDAGYINDSDSHTWTFYRVATTKGSVVIRWLGESSGYYSESVSIERIYD